MFTAPRTFLSKCGNSRARLILGLVAAVLLVSLTAAAPAAAQNRSLPLYTLDRDTNLLRSFDPLTGEEVAEPVEIFDGAEEVFFDGGLALAVHPTTGDLFAILKVPDGEDQLAIIDPATGEATILGVPTLDGQPMDRISDLTFTSDGTLYGITGVGEAAFNTPSTLFTIDTATAEATAVADLAVETGEGVFQRGNSIAFNPEDGLICQFTTTQEFFNAGIIVPFFRRVDPAAAEVAGSLEEIEVTGADFGLPRSMDYFGNGMFLLLTRNPEFSPEQEFFLIKSSGEAQDLSYVGVVDGFQNHGLAFAGTPPSCPQPLYGAAHIGPSGPSLFYSIDPDTGEASLIGPTGLLRVSAMDFLPDGTLIAFGREFDDGNGLFQIDPCTGLAGANIAGEEFINPGDASVRNADGALFAVTSTFESSSLWEVDPVAGTPDFIDDILIGGEGNVAKPVALSFDSEDVLTLIAGFGPPCFDGVGPEIFAVNETTGDATFEAVLAITGFPEGFEPICPRLNALDIAGTTAYASIVSGFEGSGDNFLATGDTTGEVPVASILGPTQPGLDALATASSFADLSIVKNVSQATTIVGVPAHYAVIVTNNGIADATNVVVSDPLPADFEFERVVLGEGVAGCSGAETIACQIPNLAVGESASVTIAGEFTAPGVVSNTATVSSDVGDINLANNSASVDVAAVTLTISLSTGDVTITLTGSATLTITVTVAQGSVNDPITFGCEQLSGNVVVTCVFDPPSVIPGSGSASTTLTITVSPAATLQAPPSAPAAPLYAVWLGLPVLAFFGTLVTKLRDGGSRKRAACALALTLLVLMLLPLAGCNGGGEEEVPTTQTATFQVTGTLGGQVVVSNTVNLTVTP
jgi:uncharacterized repeat protein (TIGR01451 family)